MTSKRIAELTAIYRDGLLKDTVPFWTKHAVDSKYGGFTTYVDADGSLVSMDKAIWVQGRFTWLLARLHNEVERRPEWLRLSRHGVEFILKHAFDTDGRCFYSVTRDGRPLRKRRYLFSETFIIIALAEYARATGDENIRRKAVELYRRLIMYYRTPGLLPPKVLPQTRQWKGHSMPMILLATTQVLRRVDDHPLYREVVDQSIREVLNDFVDPKWQVLLETVGPNGEKRYDLPEGRLANPGHAIETAWFLMEEGRYRNDRELIEQGARQFEMVRAVPRRAGVRNVARVHVGGRLFDALADLRMAQKGLGERVRAAGICAVLKPRQTLLIKAVFPNPVEHLADDQTGHALDLERSRISHQLEIVVNIFPRGRIGAVLRQDQRLTFIHEDPEPVCVRVAPHDRHPRRFPVFLERFSKHS